jgi:hypothetical protein
MPQCQEPDLVEVCCCKVTGTHWDWSIANNSAERRKLKLFSDAAIGHGCTQHVCDVRSAVSSEGKRVCEHFRPVGPFEKSLLNVTIGTVVDVHELPGKT